MRKLLDTRQILNFVTLARTRSYTRTAKELNLTQSAISHAIRALETELGCQLVTKAGQQLLLTEQGELLAKEGEAILGQIEGLRNRLDELGAWGRGRLRIGASTTACQYFLPLVLREFKQSYPDCQITVLPNDTRPNLEALTQNRIDLAVVVEGDRMDDYVLHPLFEDELFLVFPPQHPWAERQRLSAADLEKETLLAYAPSTVTGQLIERYFQAQGVRMQSLIELGNMDAIKEMAKIGQGVGIVANWLARGDSEAGALIARPLPVERQYRRWALAALRGKKLSLLEETFVGIAEEAGNILTGKNRTLFE
ncbi:MAG: LysR family transcriptional regulator [Opitutales bacterium]